MALTRTSLMSPATPASARRHSGLLAIAGIAIAVLIIAAAVVSTGPGLEGWRNATHLTARLSALLFLVVFVSGALARLAPGAATRTLLRERRGVGLGFAGAHFVHLGAVVTYLSMGGSMPPIFVPVLGGFGYVLIALMAMTSNDWSVRVLGRNWKRLHMFGVSFLWLAFAFNYAGPLARPGLHDPVYYLMSALFLSALAVRLLCRARFIVQGKEASTRTIERNL
jgi:DMSO/TMAO reductase YedYZ heme-binding membrane subunit